MKFIKFFFLGGILSLTIINLAFSSIEIETDGKLSYEVELVQVAPIVDGILDDPAWRNANYAKLEWETSENIFWNSKGDFDAQFSAVWRDSNLYLAIRFRDDIIKQRISESMEYDRFELYFDLENSGYMNKRCQYTIPVNDNNSRQDPNNPSVIWNLRKGICELSFNLGEIPRKGKIIGFGIYYKDVDFGELVENQIGWAPKEGILPGEEEKLGEFLFDSDIKPANNKIVTQWGKIKTLF